MKNPKKRVKHDNTHDALGELTRFPRSLDQLPKDLRQDIVNHPVETMSWLGLLTRMVGPATISSMCGEKIFEKMPYGSTCRLKDMFLKIDSPSHDKPVIIFEIHYEDFEDEEFVEKQEALEHLGQFLNDATRGTGLIPEYSFRGLAPAICLSPLKLKPHPVPRTVLTLPFVGANGETCLFGIQVSTHVNCKTICPVDYRRKLSRKERILVAFRQQAN
jgi:hypothetical protein